VYGAEFAYFPPKKIHTLDNQWAAVAGPKTCAVPAKFWILTRPTSSLPSFKIRAAPLPRFAREVWLESSEAKKPDGTLTYRTVAGLVGAVRSQDVCAGDFGSETSIRASLDFFGLSLSSVYHLHTAEIEHIDLTVTPPELVSSKLV
jgi:hypothetical protein